MTAVEARAWVTFTNVVQGFLGDKKDDNYKEIVDELLSKSTRARVQNEHQTALLTQSLGQVSRQPGDDSEEQGERFHQDIKVMEDRCQGRWDSHMVSDYC